MVNGVTQSWQTVGGATQYSFSTADGYHCQTNANMQWGCLLNGVIVLEIPVVILPISEKTIPRSLYSVRSLLFASNRLGITKLSLLQGF